MIVKAMEMVEQACQPEVSVVHMGGICLIPVPTCNDWLVRCGGGSVRAETKSRLHQQYIRVL